MNGICFHQRKINDHTSLDIDHSISFICSRYCMMARWQRCYTTIGYLNRTGRSFILFCNYSKPNYLRLEKSLPPVKITLQPKQMLKRLLEYMCAVTIRGLFAGDKRWLRCNMWPLPLNEQLSLKATLSVHLLVLSLFINASVNVVSHVSHILHIEGLRLSTSHF